MFNLAMEEQPQGPVAEAMAGTSHFRVVQGALRTLEWPVRVACALSPSVKARTLQAAQGAWEGCLISRRETVETRSRLAEVALAEV